MSLYIQTLEDRPIEELTALFNYGFQEYLIPMKLTVEHAVQMIERENIDLSLSVEGVQAGQKVGFCWTGVRGDMAWCGGIAVGPEHRGKGYGKEIMVKCIELLRRHGMKHYSLECIKENERGLNLYNSLGFKLIGDLYHLRNVNPLPLKTLSGQYKRVPGSEVDVFRYWDELHQVQKSWQGDLASIMYMTAGLNFELYLQNEQVEGMVIYTEHAQGIVIRDLSVRDENKELCRTMLAELHKHRKPIYNQFVPEKSAVATVMLEAGYESYINQVQMLLEL